MAENTTATQTSQAQNGDGDGAEVKTLQAKLRAAEAEANAALQREADMQARVARIERDARTARFESLSQDWPGERATHLQVLEHLATSTEEGEESEVFQAYVTQQTALVEQMRSGALFAVQGADESPEAGNSAYDQLVAKGREIAEKEGCTREQGFTRACERNPDLYAQMEREQ